jgi:DNA polymerase V
MFLAKVAMDTEAKHNKNFISKWTYEDVKTKLQEITPLSKICGIGKNYEKHLNDLGIHKLKDIFKYQRTFYIKRFGIVAGNDLWCKANGIDFKSVQEENRREKEKSMSLSQILMRDYTRNEAFLIAIEMNDMLCRKLRNSNKLTGRITFGIKYSKELNKGFHDSISIDKTDDINIILDVLKYIYESNIEDLPIRKISIHFSDLIAKRSTQLSLFDNNNKTKKYTDTLDKIYTKHGPVTLLRASSLLQNSTIKNREKFKNII